MMAKANVTFWEKINKIIPIDMNKDNHEIHKIGYPQNDIMVNNLFEDDDDKKNRLEYILDKSTNHEILISKYSTKVPRFDFTPEELSRYQRWDLDYQEVYMIAFNKAWNLQTDKNNKDDDDCKNNDDDEDIS